MWWLKLFWVEMFAIPILFLYYLISKFDQHTAWQMGTIITYTIVLLTAAAGYGYTWQKKKQKS
jgi:NADH:ubiquinone oxidoreductase subunit 3 (subunit A)|tara:strand:- start:1851 stop:2039 length:189 start_codon:yes stop_codon:yes gene_type:complete